MAANVVTIIVYTVISNRFKLLASGLSLAMMASSLKLAPFVEPNFNWRQANHSVPRIMHLVFDPAIEHVQYGTFAEKLLWKG